MTRAYSRGIIASLLLTLASAHSGWAGQTEGLLWLEQQRELSGAYGSRVETAETLITQLELGVIDYDLEQSKIWLEGLPDPAAELRALRARLLGDADDIDALFAELGIDGGWGYLGQTPGDALTTALVLDALRTNQLLDHPAALLAASWLYNHQNPDGSWSYNTHPGDENDGNTFLTALVLRTLIPVADHPTYAGLSLSISRARQYLAMQANGDGSYGPANPVLDTAMVLLAFQRDIGNYTAEIEPALNYLTAAQAANGSWNDDIYTTALALRAFSRPKVNLTIPAGGLTLVGDAPITGQTATFRVRVENTGLTIVPSTAIRVWLDRRSAGNELTSQLEPSGFDQLGNLNPGESVDIEFAWDTNGAPTGELLLIAQVDPDDEYVEVQEDDNAAMLAFEIIPETELELTDADFSATPNPAGEQEQVTLNAGHCIQRAI